MKYPKYKYVFAFLDWLTIIAAFIVALKLQTRYTIDVFKSQFPYIIPEIWIFMGYAAFFILILQHNNLYKINVVLSVADQITRLAKSVAYSVAGLVILSFFTRSPIVVNSRLAILFFSITSFIFLSGGRLVLYRIGLFLLSRSNLYNRYVLIIGAGKSGRLLAANLSEKNPYGLKIIGFLDDLHAIGSPIYRGYKVIGNLDNIEAVTEKYAIDEIIVCVDNASHEQLIEILERCQKTNSLIKIASPLYDIIPASMFTERYGNIPIIGVAQSGPGPIQETYKRIFDVVFASIGLIILIPLFIIIVIVIKFDSAGPVFYRQIRIGKNGKHFNFYKFRSMYVGSDDDITRKQNATLFIQNKKHIGSGSTKIVDEAKITRVGRILRKTSIDELPQLLNVLKGDMSIVGPRPCLPYEWDHYEEWHKKRLSVIPGCTGIWQVSGRSTVGFEDMVILDLYYIQNISPLLDFQLILKTIPVMVLGKGAK